MCSICNIHSCNNGYFSIYNTEYGLHRQIIQLSKAQMNLPLHIERIGVHGQIFHVFSPFIGIEVIV